MSTTPLSPLPERRIQREARNTTTDKEFAVGKNTFGTIHALIISAVITCEMEYALATVAHDEEQRRAWAERLWRILRYAYRREGSAITVLYTQNWWEHIGNTPIAGFNEAAISHGFHSGANALMDSYALLVKGGG